MARSRGQIVVEIAADVNGNYSNSENIKMKEKEKEEKVQK